MTEDNKGNKLYFDPKNRQSQLVGSPSASIQNINKEMQETSKSVDPKELMSKDTEYLEALQRNDKNPAQAPIHHSLTTLFIRVNTIILQKLLLNITFRSIFTLPLCCEMRVFGSKRSFWSRGFKINSAFI